MYSTFENIPFLIEILLIVTAFLILVILYLRWKRWAASRKTRKRFARGRKLELQAKEFLERKGYRVIGIQEKFRHSYYVDNEHRFSSLVVDYVVTKGGKRYLVEVKSGQSAPSISNSNTRRQLLEYNFAIPSDGVILLDMEDQILEKVKFIPVSEASKAFLLKLVLVAAIATIFIPILEVKLVVAALFFLIFLLNSRQISYISKKLSTLLSRKK